MLNSELLLGHALKIIEGAELRSDDWSIGGGTVLALTYNHRLSKDIDIFLTDVQYLSRLSPRLNNAADDALDYNEDARFISLTYPEGKIDFIACPAITKFSPIETEIYGSTLYLDDSVEIVAKKVFYRGSYVMPRDVFDLAIVYDSDRKTDIIDAMRQMPTEFDKFSKNLEKFQKNVSHSMLYSVENKNMVLDGGKYMIGRECDVCLELVRKIFHRC